MNIAIKPFGMEHMTETGAQRATAEKNGAKNNNIFGGDLTLVNDPVEQRRKEAQEQAWSIVENAWGSDSAVDQMIDDRMGHYAEMEAQKKEAQGQLKTISDEMEALKEQRETMDENDYKSMMAELSEQAGVWQKRIADADKLMRDDIADVRSIEIERLKSSPVQEAKEAAEAVMEAANDEITGMLIGESKEHIDEKLEETKEESKETMEEKEEKEELLEAQRAERAMQEAFIEGTKEAVRRAEALKEKAERPDMEISEMAELVQSSGSVTKDVGQSLDEIKSSMKLLEADLKGIRVDEEV